MGLAGLAVSAAMVLNPQVSQATIGETVCRPGWAATVRPSSSYVRGFERGALAAGADPAAFVVDHVVPISLGGHPRDRRNLRVQAIAEARAKDRDEARLHRAVCAGRLSLEAAQAQLRALWP